MSFDRILRLRVVEDLNLKQMLKIIASLLSIITFLAAIWIVVPAPAYNVWLFSVAAGEWSLWLGAASILAIILCVFSLNNNGKLGVISLIFAVSALLISLFPLISVLSLANENNVSLSLSEYFSGLKLDDSSEMKF